MNKATKQMKEETQPLVDLIKETNSLLESAEENGVSIELNCGGSLGPKESTTFVVLNKCTANYLKKSGSFSQSKIEEKLKQIEKKLKELTEAGYCITLDSHNRNTYATLHLENICMVLFGYDF